MPAVRGILYDAGRTLLRPRPQGHDIWVFLSHQLGIELATKRELPDVRQFYYARLGQDGLGAYDSDERARSFWTEYYVQALLDAGVDLPREELLSAGHAPYDRYQRPGPGEAPPEG